MAIVKFEKKVSASKRRKEAVFLTDRFDKDRLKTEIAKTGYTFLSAQSEPYKK
ncbi:MAG: hypothetical protein IKZ59_01420 [Clostridia bacterium]|nr:hypothetical protein [Clostridia bacterium]